LWCDGGGEETKPNTTKADNTITKQSKLNQKTHKMLNQKKCTKTKSKPKPTLIFKNCSYVCVCTYHCAQLSYTTQHRTVLTIFPLILQTITIAQMMSTGGKREISPWNQRSNWLPRII